jgi:hypothetical protein
MAKKSKKLSQADYFELQTQYEKTPDPADGFMASGEHYALVAILNRMGYTPRSREEAIKIAERLLSNGYE